MAGLSLAGLDDAPNVISLKHVRRVNALMMTCGHYNRSSDFAFWVCLPGKSGVGGGVLIIAAKETFIAIWPLGLIRYGTS